MRFEDSVSGRGKQASTSSLTFIPLGVVLRPLFDRIVVKPLDVVHSRILIVPVSGKPVRGIVRAVGPGMYRKAYNAPKRYDTHPEDPNRRKRTKMWDSNVFIPMQIKVGDLIELGVFEIDRFEGFYWGNDYCIWATERDVCGVVEEEAASITIINKSPIGAPIFGYGKITRDGKFTTT